MLPVRLPANPFCVSGQVRNVIVLEIGHCGGETRPTGDVAAPVGPPDVLDDGRIPGRVECLDRLFRISVSLDGLGDYFA